MEKAKIVVIVGCALWFIWMFLHNIDGNAVVLKQKYIMQCNDLYDDVECIKRWQAGERVFNPALETSP